MPLLPLAIVFRTSQTLVFPSVAGLILRRRSVWCSKEAGELTRESRILFRLRELRMAVLTILLIAVSVIAVIVVLGLYQPFWIVRAVQEAIPEVIFYVDTDRPHICLTLDDGPDPETTPTVLRVLREHRVKATWFVMGSRVTAYDTAFRQILSEGHQVANHFWAEGPQTWRMDRARFLSDLKRTEHLINQETRPKFLRPASGWFRPWAIEEARRLGYRIVLGSAYASDPAGPPNRYIVWALSKLARPGAILVLHVGPGRTYAAELLPDLIARVRAKGLDFVTLDRLWAEGKERARDTGCEIHRKPTGD